MAILSDDTGGFIRYYLNSREYTFTELHNSDTPNTFFVMPGETSKRTELLEVIDYLGNRVALQLLPDGVMAIRVIIKVNPLFFRLVKNEAPGYRQSCEAMVRRIFTNSKWVAFFDTEVELVESGSTEKELEQFDLFLDRLPIVLVFTWLRTTDPIFYANMRSFLHSLGVYMDHDPDWLTGYILTEAQYLLGITEALE